MDTNVCARGGDIIKPYSQDVQEGTTVFVLASPLEFALLTV